MRSTLFCLILVPGLLRAQFSGPNAVTYNAAKDKYFISNLTGKNVIAMDRSMLCEGNAILVMVH